MPDQCWHASSQTAVHCTKSRKALTAARSIILKQAHRFEPVDDVAELLFEQFRIVPEQRDKEAPAMAASVVASSALCRTG
jgi:hypothetical protein